MLEEDKGKSSYVKLLLVIPGKNEPKSMWAYFRFLMDDIRKYGPAGTCAASYWKLALMVSAALHCVCACPDGSCESACNANLLER